MSRRARLRECFPFSRNQSFPRYSLSGLNWIVGYAASPGGRRAAIYWSPNARKAVSPVAPMATIPSWRLRPSTATHLPDRIDNSGRRTVAGLPRCVAKYNSARSFTAITSKRSFVFHSRSFAKIIRNCPRKSSLNPLGKLDDRFIGKKPMLIRERQLKRYNPNLTQRPQPQSRN
jgi:hypothetical protein